MLMCLYTLVLQGFKQFFAVDISGRFVLCPIDFAIYGKAEEFIKFIQKYYVSQFSNCDCQRFDEKYIKAIILTLIF
jgi:hypothetical protein